MNMNSFSNDVNGKQTNQTMLGKRKKVREKRGNYLQKWLDKSMQHSFNTSPDYDLQENYGNQMNSNCWNPQYAVYGQRLISAASDPSVFRYSNPYGFPPEPMSLPVYPPIMCPPPLAPYPNIPSWGPQSPLKHPQISSRRNRVVINSRKSPFNRKNKSLGNSNDFSRRNGHNASKTSEQAGAASSVNSPNVDFTSLPPAINHSDPFSNSQEGDSSENQRRFSDPGVPQNQLLDQSQESQDDSNSESSDPGGSQVDSRLIMCLVDQINSLKDTNRKLYKALQDTRGELDALKQQSAIWKSESGPQRSAPAPPPPLYSPGMLSDLVREIRDAARIREEALYTKVRSLLEERNTNKNQIHLNHSEKSRTNDRLGKLEDELHNLRIHQGRDESLSSPCSMQGLPLTQAEQERLRLQAELNEERVARMTADAHAHKLELLVTQLRSKRAPTPSQAVTPSTPDALHMVLGPVTDL